MSRWLEELQKELRSSVELIDRKLDNTEPTNTVIEKSTTIFVENTESILDTCKLVLEKAENIRPKLRVLHHMACSGGSLITKCFSAMPNNFILSEVHPHSYRHLPADKATFLPSDIATLAHQAKFPDSDALARKIFKSAIHETYQHVDELGGILVLRDHSHSDYCVGSSFTEKSVVRELLNQDFEILSLVTVRNPIDSYASLQSNYWLHFNPQTFEEYCIRVIHFLSQFRKKQIIKYESFTRSPDKVMRKMCNVLQVEFNDSYKDLFDQFKVTGDSGRTGEKIAIRPRREISPEFACEIKKSKTFTLLCKKYGFNPAI
ncbi:hypothetical protein [uncultured Paraglaciecola sp.]|uniref:hypothetical protein n=1 Tax=uncultured Paraglaciecola sp. TaxID=1765024 RepID=UPI00261CC356|nr:hypothetical protein [uncultured Paraglaciecola sp.]